MNATENTAFRAADTTVMILAAGHGKRMLPLTEHTPKPLLKAGNKSLLEHHLEKLSHCGFRDIVINVAYLGEQIIESIADGQKFGLRIRYSDERESGALETAGGIVQALPLIKSDPFLVLNGDIFTDFDLRNLLQPLPVMGRLVLVDNPQHNPDGDFNLGKNGLVDEGTPSSRLTFAGIALYKKALFKGLAGGARPLAPLLHQQRQASQLEGLHHTGVWFDIGTPARLAALDQILAKQ